MSSRSKTKSPSKTVYIGKIYADWCGHCRTLVSEWDSMKRRVKLNMGRTLKNMNIEFIEIGETEQSRALGKDLDQMLAEFNKTHLSKSDDNVALHGGYPTIFKVCNERVEYYEGERSADNIYNWATGKCSKKSLRENKKGKTKHKRKAGKKNATRRTYTWF